jgi:murein DD-endopeptidase MepM/ murein hydrolase activator NlpD
MDIILISYGRGQTRRFHLNLDSLKSMSLLVLVPALLLGGAGYIGYHLAPDVRGVKQMREAAAVWDGRVQAQRREIASLRQRLDDNLFALTRRLGQLQAHVTRLNAVGERMTRMAELDTGEFDFDNPPPLGGPEDRSAGAPAPAIDEFHTALDRFSRELGARERQMWVLRDLMVAGELREEVMPSGRPIKSGWISSGFGSRTDPFTGRHASHYGIDFAGGLGSEVISVASGVVSYAGRRSGYGNMVEINHGNGYVTRYGHNRKILVAAGERVEKGRTIAEMGSTGRSTGPHVHFEVLRNGRIVNPTSYIYASR